MPFDNAQGTLPRWLAFLLALSERNESKCAPAATRTRNLKVKSFLLYQLSYGGGFYRIGHLFVKSHQPSTCGVLGLSINPVHVLIFIYARRVFRKTQAIKIITRPIIAAVITDFARFKLWGLMPAVKRYNPPIISIKPAIVGIRGKLLLISALGIRRKTKILFKRTKIWQNWHAG